MSFIIILFFSDCREGEWIKSANFIPSFAKEFVKSPETLRSQLTVNNILIDGSNLSQSNRPSPGEELERRGWKIAQSSDRWRSP